MEFETLDDDFGLEGINENKAGLLNWVSIIFLWIGIGSFFNVGSRFEEIFYGPFILVLIATILSYFKFNVGLVITSIILLLGIFSQVFLFPFQYVLSFGIGNFGFDIETITLLVGVIHFITNKDFFLKMINYSFKDNKTYEEDKARMKSHKINLYKKMFAKKSNEELRVKIDNVELIPEAIQAAKELLEERNEIS